MKKLLLTALIAVSLVSSSFAAGENNINRRIKDGFVQDFKDVQDVKWTTSESYVIASFVLNNKATQAFYDFNGELIGTTHAALIDNLPASAKRTLAKRYKDYTVKETIGFEKNSEFSYFVSLTNDKENIVLQVQNGQVSLYK